MRFYTCVITVMAFSLLMATSPALCKTLDEILQQHDPTSQTVGEGAPSVEGDQPSVATESTQDTKPWRLHRVPKGDQSQDTRRVKAFQIALQALGYLKGCQPKGWFGPRTQRAVMKFQQDHGLPVTGFVNRHDYRLIRALAAAAGNASATATLPASTSSQPPTPPASSQSFPAPADLAGYLAKTAHCDIDDPAIKAKARELRGNSPYETIQNVFTFVKHIRYGFYFNTKYGAVEGLDTKRLNCVDHSHLLVALLRANGIPARYAGSKVQTESHGVVGHCWAQAWCNGEWLDMDACFRTLALGKLRLEPQNVVKYKAEFKA